MAWTTTPWTLPSNLALCVNPEFDYLRVRDPGSGKVYIVGEARLAEIPGAVPKGKKGGAKSGGGKDGGVAAPKGFEVGAAPLGAGAWAWRGAALPLPAGAAGDAS